MAQKKNAGTFDWKNYCSIDSAWCCKDENPYLSKEDGVGKLFKRLTQKTDGSCVLLKSGRCGSYNERPFECQIFPFDIKYIEDKLTWVLWQNCPASKDIDPESHLRTLEESLLKKYDFGYIQKYVNYHQENEPKKYSQLEFEILREVKWPNR